MARANDLLRAELKRRRLTQPDLAALLTQAGHPTEAESLKVKIKRGAFSADWFLECLRVIGCETVRIDA